MARREKKQKQQQKRLLFLIKKKYYKTKLNKSSVSMSVSICYHCYQLLAFQSLLSYKQTATDVRWMRLAAKKQRRKK